MQVDLNQVCLQQEPAESGGSLVQDPLQRRCVAPQAEIKVVVRTTDQLSGSERAHICDLFFRVFNKSMTRDAFERKFLLTPKGYSYHGLMLCEDAVVGALSAIPMRYEYFGDERVFALCVDTMIDAAHRGGGHIVKMADAVNRRLVQDGIPFIFGFPNEHFYPVQTRFLRYQDVGELDYYLLPLNVGAIVPGLPSLRAGLNGLSRRLCKYALAFSRTPKSPPARHSIAKLVDAQFEQHRYDDSYCKITLPDGAACWYRVFEEEGGIRTLYIIDVVPLTPACLARAVRRVFDAAQGSVDIIMYVGKLPSRPAGLWKVPDSRRPRRMRMTGKILIPDLVDSRVFDIKNWRVNVSDFDAR